MACGAGSPAGCTSETAAASSSSRVATRSCSSWTRRRRSPPVISASLTAYLVQGLRRDGGERRGGTTGQLTASELNVLRLVADGRTDKQISATLYISPRTVQSHLAQIRAKIGVRRRTQLARWATEHLVT